MAQKSSIRTHDGGTHAYNPSTQEWRAGGSDAQGHPPYLVNSRPAELYEPLTEKNSNSNRNHQICLDLEVRASGAESPDPLSSGLHRAGGQDQNTLPIERDFPGKGKAAWEVYISASGRPQDSGQGRVGSSHLNTLY